MFRHIFFMPWREKLKKHIRMSLRFVFDDLFEPISTYFAIFGVLSLFREFWAYFAIFYENFMILYDFLVKILLIFQILLLRSHTRPQNVHFRWKKAQILRKLKNTPLKMRYFRKVQP